MTERNLTTIRRWPIITTRDGMVLYVPPSDQFSLNSIPAVVDPFLTPTTQEFPLGTKLVYGDRVFRYCRLGAVAQTAGKLMQAVVPLAGRIAEAIDAPAIGATVIAFTPAVAPTDDLALDELADGYIGIDDDTGAGHLYRIKSHPAIAGAVSGNLTLYDPIVIAPAAASTASVMHNKYRNLIIHPSPATAKLIGVLPTDFAANDYGWVQTGGPAKVLTEGTIVINEIVVDSASADGAVAPMALTEGAPNTDAGQHKVGVALQVNATTTYSIIELMLEMA